MRQLIKGAGKTASMRLALAIALVMALAAVSFTDPPTTFVDYGALLGTAKTEIQGATTSSLPVVLLVMAGMLGIGIAIKWIKKASKSS